MALWSGNLVSSSSDSDGAFDSSWSPIVSLTLEDLDNLMMDDSDDNGDGGAKESIVIAQELQQLILLDSTSSPSPCSSSSQQLAAQSDLSSLDGSERVAIEVEDEVSSGSYCSTSSTQESSRPNSRRSHEDLRDESPTHQQDRGESHGFSPDSGTFLDRPSTLIDVLQQCIASHLATSSTAIRSASPKRKKKREAPSSEEEDAVEGLKTAIQIRRQRPSQLDGQSYGWELRGSVSRDVMALLHDCAHAVAVRDVANANSLAVTLRGRYGASPHAADPRQRVAFYFVESLMARVLGTGTALHTATSHRGGPDVMDCVYEFRLHATPSPLIPHFASTQAIVRAARGHDFLHVVEIGMARNRFQWSLLLQALARRRGGAPHRLRVTAVDSPQNARLLAQLAHRIVTESARLGMLTEVELEIADAHVWESVFPRIAARTRPDEALAVNALFALDFLEDETAVQARSPRRAVLAALRRMEPTVVVLGINHGYRAVPQFSFLQRFVQAVTRFNAKFDAALECGADAAHAEGRAAYEGQFLGPEILNLVACDGVDRLVRTAPCEEWEKAMRGAGFLVIPVDEITLWRAQSMMRRYNRNFELGHGDGWINLSWKKVTTQCVSVWRPERVLVS